MKKKPQTSLLQCLIHAVSLYNDRLHEEQGGFILKQPGKEIYEFVPVRNQMTGTPRAAALYIADTTEFNDKVVVRVLDDKWTIFASYHTHPLGMRALPSFLDISELFTSFPTNFIYSPGRELNRFDYDPEHLEYSRYGKNPKAKWNMTVILPQQNNSSTNSNG